MKSTATLFIASLALAAAALSSQAFAQPAPAAGAGSTADAGSAADSSEGEVRKIDKENNKIMLRHGPIKNLGMPGMTMVFRVKDPAMLDTVQQGDKVTFKADKVNGALVVTEMQPTTR